MMTGGTPISGKPHLPSYKMVIFPRRGHHWMTVIQGTISVSAHSKLQPPGNSTEKETAAANGVKRTSHAKHG